MYALVVSLLGVASLFAMQFVSVLQGRGLLALPFPLLHSILVLFFGTLCGGLIVNPHRSGKFGSICLLCLSAVSGFFWWNSIVNGHEFSGYAACFFGAMLLPSLLSRLLTVSTSPGLHLGMALALGDFFWLFLYFLPAPLSSQAMQCILAGLVLLGGCLGAAGEFLKKTPPEQKGTKTSPASSLGKESVYYLVAIAAIFFLQNSLIDIPFFRMHAVTFTIPAQVHLYIWPVYPLCGWFIDKYGADIRLFLACVAGNILSPALVGFSEHTGIYWGIYAATLASRTVGLVYLLLVFGRIRHKFGLPALVVSLPLLALLGSLEVVYLLVARFPGTTYILLLGLFLVASFSYISSRIQFALTLSGIHVPAHGKTDTEKSIAGKDYSPEVFAHFSEKYGISMREQDVLQLVVEGHSTRSICENLHISENTVKSHIRQLLRKTESENRITLVALFFNEAQTIVTLIHAENMESL